MKNIRILLSCCTALYCSLTSGAYAQGLPAVEIHMDVISKFKNGAYSAKPARAQQAPAIASAPPLKTLQQNNTVFSPSNNGANAFFPGISQAPVIPAAGTLPPAGNILNIMNKEEDHRQKKQPVLSAVTDSVKRAGDAISKHVSNFANTITKDTRPSKNAAALQQRQAQPQAQQPITRIPGESESEYLTRKYNNIPAPSVVRAKSPTAASPTSKKVTSSKTTRNTPEKGNIYTSENLEIRDRGLQKNLATIRRAPSVLNKKGQNEGYNFVNTPSTAPRTLDKNAPLPWQADKSVRKQVTPPQNKGAQGLNTVYKGPVVTKKTAAPAKPAAPAVLQKKSPTDVSKKIPKPVAPLKKLPTPVAPPKISPVIASKKPSRPVAPPKKPAVVKNIPFGNPTKGTPPARAAVTKPAIPEKPKVIATTERKAPPFLRKPSAPSVKAKAQPVTASPPSSAIVNIADIAPPPGIKAAKPSDSKRLSLFEESRIKRRKQEEEKTKAKKTIENVKPKETSKTINTPPSEPKDADTIRKRIQDVRAKSLANLNEATPPVVAVPQIPEPIIAPPVIEEPAAAPSAEKTERASAVEALRAAIKRRNDSGNSSPLPPSDKEIRQEPTEIVNIDDALDADIAQNFNDFPLENEDTNPLSDIASLAEDMQAANKSKKNTSLEIASLSKKSTSTPAATTSNDAGILFAVGEDTLTSAHKSALDAFLSKTKSVDNGTVFVTGYATASDKSPEYISLRRVVAVRNYIMNSGFPNNRIRIKAKGNKTESDNLRDKVILEIKPSK